MRVLTKYLLREHLAPFLFACCALTGLLVLNQLARQFANLIGKGLDWGTIGSVFGLSLPFILAMTIPMAVLVAVLHAFGRMAGDSEITALKATGVHLATVVRPVLIAAIMLAAFEFVFVDQVLPRANHRLKNLLVDIARKKPTFDLKEQMVNEVVPGQLFLRAGRIDQATDRLRDVIIHDLADGVRRRTIYAESGFVRFNTDRTDLFLTLFNGRVHDYDRSESEVFRRIFFNTDLIRVHGVSNQLQSTGPNDFRGDREMSLCEMERVVTVDYRNMANIREDHRRLVERDVLALAGIVPPRTDTAAAPPRRTLTTLYCQLLSRIRKDLVPEELRADEPAAAAPVGAALVAAPVGAALVAALQDTIRPRPIRANRSLQQANTVVLPDDAPPSQRPRIAGDASGNQLRGQLGALQSRRATLRQHAASYQVEIHKKYTLAVSCIVFVLIGAPVALRFPRGGIGLVIGASVAIFGIYYIGLIGGESLADRAVIAPFWAMWTPNLLMAGLGAVLFARLGRERATGRDSGFSDMLKQLPRVLRRRRTAAR